MPTDAAPLSDVIERVPRERLGYDLFAEVAPGQPGRITFRADTAGVFEAELEDLGVPVVELTVNP